MYAGTLCAMWVDAVTMCKPNMVEIGHKPFSVCRETDYTKGGIIFTRMGGPSICDELSAIFFWSPPPLNHDYGESGEAIICMGMGHYIYYSQVLRVR